MKMPKKSWVRIAWERQGRTVALVLSLLSLLPVLAVLQYRWIGEVSEAERERMSNGLRSAASRFGQDFNQELGRIMRAIQTGRPGAQPDVSRLAENIYEWTESTSHRGMVRDFYITDSESVQRLNPQSGYFEQAVLPPHIAAIHRELVSRAQTGFRPGSGEGAETANLVSDWSVLVMPRFGMPPFGGGGRGPGPGPGRGRGPGPGSGRGLDFPRMIAGWVFAELDSEYITKKLLPQLVRRHFRDDYQVEIVSRVTDDAVIFRTDERESIRDADTATGLFRVGPDFGFRFQGGGPQMGGPWMGRGGGREAKGTPGGRPEDGGRWELRVKHKSGSLDQAVAMARYRNLAISGGILMLMAASIGLLLLTTRRAQRLARLQMEFVAGVSHELRTPLTVICSAGDNLADGLVVSEQQARRYGSVIRDEGRRLADMVEQILRFAGIQSGRARYDVQPVDVMEVVDRAIQASGPALQQSGCRLEQDIEPGLPPVMADPTALTHCLSNLIGNAAKYAKEGGWIGVQVQSSGDQVAIRVRDRGPGIEAGDLPHVFEPFYRGQRAVSEQIQGAGMGLSLVKRIVEAHSGSVAVDSETGQGACFSIHIPAASTSE